MDRFICMTCGKLFKEGELPTIGTTDGCCSTGSLIEVKNENENIGYWLILGDSVFDKRKMRCGELKPSID